MTTEELQDAIRLIQETIDESVKVWDEYESQFTRDYAEMLVQSPERTAFAQAFRIQKAAHLRQIALARAELAGLKAIL